MRISNTFEVPLPPDEAWRTLMDIPSIIPCMPGAELLEKVDDKTYKGKVSVRLGPVALSFIGLAAFEEVDDAAHKAVVKASGTDAKGRGGANAVINFGIQDNAGASAVLIETELNLSGSVAQYGRGAGMIQGVATQLISQFAKTLEAQISLSRDATLVSPEAQRGLARGSASERAADGGISPIEAAARGASAKPIGGFSLAIKVLLSSILGLFRSRA